MQGNFEFDRGRYPFTATRIGDSYKVLYTPSQQPVPDVKLPLPVAEAVALRLNTQYWASKAGGRPFDGTSKHAAQLVRAETATAYDKKLIDGTQVMGIHNELDNLEA